jgi:hypothetical protein
MPPGREASGLQPARAAPRRPPGITEQKSPNAPASGPTKMLITNSGKYGLTVGSYVTEYLELTELGRAACNPDGPADARLLARFKLAIEHVEPFVALYDAFVGKKLLVQEVMKDVLGEYDFEIGNPKECVDSFIVNAKDLGLLRTIAGAETLISIDQPLRSLPRMEWVQTP